MIVVDTTAQTAEAEWICKGTMNRYIEADELLKRLNACKYPAEKTTHRQAAYNAAISDTCRNIDAMPIVDVIEVQHGYWELYDICSVCGAQAEQQTNYCPNCGAQMNLVEDE